MPFGTILLFELYSTMHISISQHNCDRASEKGPSRHKIHHITKWYIFYNIVNCNMLPMKLFIDGEMFTYIALADHQLHMMQQI